MDMLKVINTREKKELFHKLQDLYGIDPSVLKQYEYLMNSEKIWIFSKNTASIDTRKLRIEGIGMLFARLSSTIKLTTNAIQLFGRHATKNIVELDSESTEKYIRGLDITGIEDKDASGYVIVKSGKDFLGCGLLKDGQLKNQIPKQRRIKKF